MSKSEKTVKITHDDMIDYITFQLDALEATLKKFGLKTTLCCMQLMRSIFEKEQKERNSAQ